MSPSSTEVLIVFLPTSAASTAMVAAFIQRNHRHLMRGLGEIRADLAALESKLTHMLREVRK